jgi:hypothetical protein
MALTSCSDKALSGLPLPVTIDCVLPFRTFYQSNATTFPHVASPLTLFISGPVGAERSQAEERTI